MTSIYIPYGAYWCTPFAKWQGNLAHLHSVEFAAYVAKKTLADKNIPVDVFDYGVLGMTVPQISSFFGLPWLTGMIGAVRYINTRHFRCLVSLIIFDTLSV